MVKALQGQSIIDLAVQTAGSAEAAFALALANGLSVSDALIPGQELVSTDIVNKNIATYYQNKNLNPATWQDDGIEYFGIEYDFVLY